MNFAAGHAITAVHGGHPANDGGATSVWAMTQQMKRHADRLDTDCIFETSPILRYIERRRSLTPL